MFRIQGLLLPAAAFCALLGLVVVGSTTAPREADRLDPNDEVETAGFQGPGGPGPGGPGGPGGPPGGFGPGMFLAPAVIEAADADKDGRLAPEEAAKAAEAFVRDADTEKKGSLDLAGLGRRSTGRSVRPRASAPTSGGGPPPGFGPGTFLAPQILELADANKDGRLSPDEAARAAERVRPRGRPGQERARSTRKPWPRRSTAGWARRPASAPAGRWARSASWSRSSTRTATAG